MGMGRGAPWWECSLEEMMMAFGPASPEVCSE